MSLELELRNAFSDVSVEQQNAAIDIARTYLFSTMVVTELSDNHYNADATELWMNFLFNNSAFFVLSRVGWIKETSEAPPILNKIAETVKLFSDKAKEKEARVD